MLGVPLMRQGTVIGAFSLHRMVARPFTDKQIELVTTFADQAVIAIENARLLNELRQRTGDLTESLERQTATGEVLKVISSSPGELEPVFQSMLENAIRICDAAFGNIYRLGDDDALHLMAALNVPPAFAEFRRQSPFRPNPYLAVGRNLKTAVQIADVAADPGYLKARDKNFVAAVELGGVRTLISVPMLKEDKLVGLFSLFRQQVRPFTDKQIDLVKNFAAQAVIAIENARLLNELRQRTDDLTESLEQQTATSEVLQVISSSPSELNPVFETILANAARLCEAQFGILALHGDGVFRRAAMHNPPPAFAKLLQGDPVIKADMLRP